MEQLILFDGSERTALLPYTFTRPAGDLRCGILTLREKWEHDLNHQATFLTVPYLQEKFPAHPGNDNLLVNGTVLPDPAFVDFVGNLQTGTLVKQGERTLAARLNREQFDRFTEGRDTGLTLVSYDEPVLAITRPWEIFRYNGVAIEADIARIRPLQARRELLDNNFVTNAGHFYAEDDVDARHAFIDCSTGPVYLGKGVTIQEGAMIKGPFAACEQATLKMGAKVYGPTTIGPHCKAGGEINNSVFWGYSNKAHDGFLGNAVIGQWCNLGADTNNSNLKNNYDPVKVWDYIKEGFVPTHLQFCGLFMADHTKCGINTMFNTGTVTGVSANIFGSGFPRTFIPSFSWGGASGFREFRLEKACETAAKMMERRDIPFNATEETIFKHIFKATQKFRGT